MNTVVVQSTDPMVEAEKIAGTSWTVKETRALFSPWGKADAKSQLDKVTRNHITYEQISRDLDDLGCECHLF